MTKDGLSSQWQDCMAKLANAYLQRDVIEAQILDLKTTKRSIESQYQAFAEAEKATKDADVLKGAPEKSQAVAE